MLVVVVALFHRSRYLLFLLSSLLSTFGAVLRVSAGARGFNSFPFPPTHIYKHKSTAAVPTPDRITHPDGGNKPTPCTPLSFPYTGCHVQQLVGSLGSLRAREGSAGQNASKEAEPSDKSV